jgi:hypothetical protein
VSVFLVGIGNGLSGPLKYLESLTVCIFITFVFFWLLSRLLKIVCG